MGSAGRIRQGSGASALEVGAERKEAIIAELAEENLELRGVVEGNFKLGKQAKNDDIEKASHRCRAPNLGSKR